MKKYTLVILGKYSDDIPYFYCDTIDKLKDIIKKEELTIWDYAIVDGVLLKSFDNTSVSINTLK